jgi:organic radical activating enzyme
MCGQRARYRRVLRRRRTELPDRVISEMLSLLPTAALLQVSGGEPLFYPAAARIVDAARLYPQVRVEMMTNGNLIDCWTPQQKSSRAGHTGIGPQSPGTSLS